MKNAFLYKDLKKQTYMTPPRNIFTHSSYEFYYLKQYIYIKTDTIYLI